MRSVGHGYLRSAAFLLVFFFTHVSSALVLSKSKVPYYGDAFYEAVSRGERDQALLEIIRETLTSVHVKRASQADQLARSCPTGSSCYSHVAVGYEPARRKLFGELHLVQVGREYGVLDVYCEKTFLPGDFKSSEAKPGPDTIPEGNVVNAEHTWPQSRFNRATDPATQKCDLHHLFPTDNRMNSTRGNLKFGEVDNPREVLKCPISKIGQINSAQGEFFEPPDKHKGNAARALLYFSIRYKIHIEPIEEKFLKKWNREDPVDAHEAHRNDRIQQIQGNRNPFVDHPELADAISDF
ncbi:MAG: endonuclease [Bdellovibrionota bacterium]